MLIRNRRPRPWRNDFQNMSQNTHFAYPGTSLSKRNRRLI
jgi:hypothetical protein